MENVFLHLVNMSITAGWLVLAVVVLRLVFRRAPKWIHCLLWVLVGVRLVCPFSFESVLSLIPSAETVPVDTFLYETPTIQSGVPVVDAVVNPVLSGSFAPQPMNSVNPMQVLSVLAAYAWVLGMALMLVYALVTTLRLKWRVRESVRLQRNIYQCDRIATPFILGVIRPRIYLPTTLTERDIFSVVAHEEAHIRRKDHWWKPLGFLLLTVYWFNPLLWLGYVLLCRDIEAACDERVIRDMDVDQRKAYSETLLACSAPRHMITACPLAFGETGVKSRIKSVLNYKKPAFWLILVAVIASVVVAVCLLTNPKKTVSDELDAYLTHVILEENQSDHTGDAYPTEAHTVFGTAKKDGKTVVYTMVLYKEYYLDENGELQVQSGSHIPTVITVDVEGNGYSLVEYWIPRDGTDYATDIRAKYPIWYWRQTDTQRHIDKHQQKTLADAQKHFSLNEEPYYEPMAQGDGLIGLSARFNWDCGYLDEDIYTALQNQNPESDLPMVVVRSVADLENFIATCDGENKRFTKDLVTRPNWATQMREVYTEEYFKDHVVLAVYYMAGSYMFEPEIVAAQYAENGTKLTVMVDVSIPSMVNDALGGYMMMTAIDRATADRVTTYGAAVRANIPKNEYVASFEKNYYMYQMNSCTPREEWRAWLSEEEWEMNTLVKNLGWVSHGHKAQYSPYVGAVNIAGETYYVNDKYDMLSSKEKTAYLTADQSAFVRSLFTKELYGKVGPVPYLEGNDPYKNEGKPYKDYTYLYGRYIGHNKAERYVILQVIHAENTDLVGKKVVVSLKELLGFGMPGKGAMIEIPYDGTVGKLDDFPMVIAQGFETSDGAAFVNFNDPGDIYDDEVGGNFTGKVKEVTSDRMLMECYDKNLCDTVWVNYTCFYPEMKPEVGDEYKVTFCDGVWQTKPPLVTGEGITAVSYATERENTFISEAEAIEIASKHWNIKPGDKDPDTGFVMSIMAWETPSYEKPHYRMALRWLVETEGGTGNFSTLDTIYIHAETGEIALPGGTTASSTQSHTTTTASSTSNTTESSVTSTTTTQTTTTTTQAVDDDANTFIGIVTQVTDTAMLVECHGADQFSLAWVSLKNHPDLNPQVGDEYRITHDGVIMETYPVQITAVVIAPLSTIPTINC